MSGTALEELMIVPARWSAQHFSARLVYGATPAFTQMPHVDLSERKAELT
jgi:hypothetical protein